ncbi:energy transducer TonB [Fulvimonas yonginensis]|uniref:Energy transducer TonB n=1 Tax=Fulvimonas yonginensis TaxID=1495200 RepID=A0ABU8J6R2_9GAMM
MPRLRVTTALSVLALFVSVWGTDWLSGLTDDWIGPPPRPGAVAAARSRHAASRHRTHAAPRVVGAQPDVVARITPPPAVLVPLEIPPSDASWAKLRGHLDGRVVLDVATDGSGRVTSADIARSSGDPVLDAHALATVRHWRFAVPSDAPEGVHGELPMRFDSGPPATPP